MQFLRTLFWVVLAVFVAIMARNNWSDVTINLWGNLQADIKIPLLIALAFLLGFLPTFLILRGQLWALKRRLLVHTRSPEVVQTPAAAPTPAADPVQHGTLQA
jgi:lipopolysaccharide assembly protein A